MATVRIPTPLRQFTRGQGQVPIAGSTLGEVLGNLERAHPGISARLLDDAGKVRRYVNIFLNDEGCHPGGEMIGMTIPVPAEGGMA